MEEEEVSTSSDSDASDTNERARSSSSSMMIAVRSIVASHCIAVSDLAHQHIARIDNNRRYVARVDGRDWRCERARPQDLSQTDSSQSHLSLCLSSH
jgi:hypothetical protein